MRFRYAVGQKKAPLRRGRSLTTRDRIGGKSVHSCCADRLSGGGLKAELCFAKRLDNFILFTICPNSAPPKILPFRAPWHGFSPRRALGKVGNCHAAAAADRAAHALRKHRKRKIAPSRRHQGNQIEPVSPQAFAHALQPLTSSPSASGGHIPSCIHCLADCFGHTSSFPFRVLSAALLLECSARAMLLICSHQ